MTRDDIIRMARESGAVLYTEPELTGARIVATSFINGALERFAALVASAEREACAMLAQDFGPGRPIVSTQPGVLVIGRWEGEQAASSGISRLIRAKSKA